MGQSEEQLESQWDKMLKIKTTGRDDSHADAFCYPYEPTPYCVLERLSNSGLIQKKQTVLDYGTGKGRGDRTGNSKIVFPPRKAY